MVYSVLKSARRMLKSPTARPIRLVGVDKLALVSAAFLLLLAFAAIFGLMISPHDPYLVNLSLRNMPPGSDPSSGDSIYFLGTDPLGRDVLARLILGARVTLLVGILSVLLSGVFGVFVGLIAGYYRGKVDDILMRIVDLVLSIPSLLIALLVLYVLGGSILNLVLVLAASRWMVYARLTRGRMLGLHEELYIEAATALGARDRRIIFVHMLPNLIRPILVLATLEVATVLLAESALSFLGLGIQPPSTSWGQMLAGGREYIRTAWWVIAMPGLAILFTTLSLNILAAHFRSSSSGVRK